MQRTDNRSARWGGVTAGLVIGGSLGLFVGDAITGLVFGGIIGLGLGVVADLLGQLGDWMAGR